MLLEASTTSIYFSSKKRGKSTGSMSTIFCSFQLQLSTLIMTENDLSYEIRGSIFKVYNNLGPGLLETAYVAALGYELLKKNLNCATQVGLPMHYESVKIDIGYRLDLLVENKIILEIKSVETLLNVHHKQVITYLKLSGLHLGLLVNFNTDDIAKNIFRKINGF